MPGASLFERIGGENAVLAAVDLFYEKVLADELVGPFFQELDMKVQTRKQVSFMTWAFGGPEEFRGRPLRESHAKLVSERGLSDAHFDRVAEHLEASLEELGIERSLIDEALAIVGSQRDTVLGR